MLWNVFPINKVFCWRNEHNIFILPLESLHSSFTKFRRVKRNAGVGSNDSFLSIHLFAILFYGSSEFFYFHQPSPRNLIDNSRRFYHRGIFPTVYTTSENKQVCGGMASGQERIL